MNRKGLLILVATALLAACNGLVGNDSVSLGNPDGSTQDATSDGSSSGSGSGGADGSSSGDSTLSDSATGSSSGSDGSGCTPGIQRCSGNGVQTCESNGQWGSPSTCTGVCVDGGCQGVCSPGALGCNGQQPQSCGSSGQWQNSGSACTNQACVSGACTGVCAPNETQCSSNGVQTCTSSGAWGTPVACVNQTCVGSGLDGGSGSADAAADSGASVSASCQGVCAPGQTNCNGQQPQTCGTNGQWQDHGSACGASQTCTSGACMGPCGPGQVNCNGQQPETCSSTGTWQDNGSACVNQTCVPATGVCTGVCAPGQTHPVACGNCGTDTQTCSASGTWQTSGTCPGQGVCAPTGTQPCNTYGTETCSASCAWGTCSCPSTPVCTPGNTQCSGSQIQTCNSCGQWGAATACGTGTQCCGGVGGTCVNIQTNASNCGYCGHNCAACSVDGVSPTCSAGACQALTLASDPGAVVVAADGTNAYFGDSSGAVKQCATSGCTNNPMVLATGQNPGAVAYDSSNVYWVNETSGQVKQCPIGGGCPLSGNTLWASASCPERIAAGNGWVYWTNECNDFSGAVQGCPATSCNASSVRTFNPDNIMSSAIALDPTGTNLYWAPYCGPSAPCHGSALESNPATPATNPSSATTVASATQGFWMVVDSTNVYWAGGNGNTIYQCGPLTSLPCTPAPIDNGTGNNANGIAVDLTPNAVGKKYVYWTDGISNGGVLAVPINSGTVLTLASSTNGDTPSDVAISGSCVYWTDNGGVHKVAKP